MRKFWGKYRGKVANNVDPMNLGRIQVEVPAVLGTGRGSWAMPCTPYAGPDVGFFAIPPVGANVWVEFEGGDPDYPIWVGGFWGEGQAPVQPALEGTKTLKTEAITLSLCDVGEQPGLSLEVGPTAVTAPLKLTMDAEGITLDNNGVTRIKLTGEAIEVSNSEQATVRVSAQEITLTSDPVSVTINAESQQVQVSNGAASAQFTADAVNIQQGAAQVSLSGDAITLAFEPASVKISASGVDVACGGATVTISDARIEAANGAGSVAISPASVNVNNGALEVT